ncbi:TlpA family protein disulfide reductase [Chitinophaga horti]|uniref:TlpA family protein disulfide reductase n=1 Tax=Chitinophaga horti TaxID=2920382 RepID=A0ABY6J7X4_9BACT|nr:TlpA disulfide reductase family protein [Chitinophaga horti]UYQ95795.1 TlpA family protein disulfide reductase [Chitinophaga horti]
MKNAKCRPLSKILGMICCLGVWHAAAVAQTDAPVIRNKIGDVAPSLFITKWLKGTPITKLEKNKVYVVEFWATWCTPCILGMPHMSDMAKRYKDVTFIGITSMEKTLADSAKAQAFADRSNGMMAYNVAFSDPKGEMSKYWISAFGQSGIPVAYVIDRMGNVAWIGHPLMGLQEAVELARQDKLTASAAQKVNEDWNAKRIHGKLKDSALKVALKENRTRDAIALNDEVLEGLPFNVAIAAGKRYALLTAIDSVAARAYGERLIKKHGNAPLVLKSVAFTIFEGCDARVIHEVKVKVTGVPDYKLARALLLKSLECSEKDSKTAMYLDRIEQMK